MLCMCQKIDLQLHIVDHFLNKRNSLFRVLFDFHERIGQQRPRNLICCDKFLDFFLFVSVGVYCFFFHLKVMILNV